MTYLDDTCRPRMLQEYATPMRIMRQSCRWSERLLLAGSRRMRLGPSFPVSRRSRRR